jgi:excisionase family DNA binding protein
MSGHITPPRIAFESGEFLRASEVARKLGVCRNSVLKLLKKGIIPGFQFGKCWLVHRATFEKYLAELVKRSKPEGQDGDE